MSSTYDGYSVFELPEKYVEMEGNPDHLRIQALDLSQEFEWEPEEEELREKAKEYMTKDNFGIPKVSLAISFIQLSQTKEYENFPLLETIKLGDIVTVEFDKLKVSTKAQCIKIEYDAITDRYIKVEIGDPEKH